MPSDRNSKYPAQGRRGPRTSTPKPHVRKNKLSELLEMGIPRRFAQQIAAGQRELNEVLQEMARDDKVDKLVAAHDIPRSLAVQVVMGQADLGGYLVKRRRHEYRAKLASRSVFDEAVRSGQPYNLAVLGRANRQVKILQSDRYELQVEDLKTGQPETIHKLTVKLVYSADDRRSVRRAIAQDKAYKSVEAEPLWRIQDRYHCPDKVLFPWLEASARVTLVTVEGDRVQGTLQWYSRYEIGVEVRGEASLVLMRHALAEVKAD